MRLTFVNRLQLCWEILTIRSRHKHPLQEKALSTFQRGYSAGMKDARLAMKNTLATCNLTPTNHNKST